MKTFTIDTDNTIAAWGDGETIPEAEARFSSENELAKLAANWPAARLVDIWNAFAGVPPFGDLRPVKRFTDRKTAVGRIWRAIQALTPDPPRPVAHAAPKPAKATKQATAPGATPTGREGSKKSIVLELLRRQKGATLADLQAATGWQAHTVRGFLSGAIGKKMGLAIESIKTPDGARSYRLKPQ